MSVYEGDSLSMSFWDARAAVRIFSPSKPNDVKFIVFMVWEEFARLGSRAALWPRSRAGSGVHRLASATARSGGLRPIGMSTNSKIYILALLSARSVARRNTTLISSNLRTTVTGGMRKVKTCTAADGDPAATVPRLWGRPRNWVSIRTS